MYQKNTPLVWALRVKNGGFIAPFYQQVNRFLKGLKCEELKLGGRTNI